MLANRRDMVGNMHFKKIKVATIKRGVFLRLDERRKT